MDICKRNNKYNLLKNLMFKYKKMIINIYGYYL